jgi:hypothetical protein
VSGTQFYHLKLASLSCQREMDEEQLKEYQERMKARWAQNAESDVGNGGGESGSATGAQGRCPPASFQNTKLNSRINCCVLAFHPSVSLKNSSCSRKNMFAVSFIQTDVEYVAAQVQE